MDNLDPGSGAAVEARALRTLGRLTSGALHEISSPLVGLIGSAELALREAEPGTKLHDRIALAHRSGVEIAEIVRALQAFVRAHAEPVGTVSLGAAAEQAVSLVARVQPVHDVTLAASGDAHVRAAPGEVASRLVELLVEALDRESRPAAIELAISTDGGDAVVAATGGGELRLPLSDA